MPSDAASPNISAAYRKTHTSRQHPAALTGRRDLQPTSPNSSPASPDDRVPRAPPSHAARRGGTPPARPPGIRDRPPFPAHAQPAPNRSVVGQVAGAGPGGARG